MASFLDKIVLEKQKEIHGLYERGGLSAFKESAQHISLNSRFKDTVSQPGLSLIAELKRASPSKGLINPDFDPISLAKRYESCGASCLSVLTEQAFFLGDPLYLQTVKNTVNLPLLRKDFIIDEIQIYESKLLGADAILLIMALLTDRQAQFFLDVAHQEGLDVLVEVHDAPELKRALALQGLDLLGINNRNLDTFQVDIQTAFRLKSMLQDFEGYVVAESGYSFVSELDALESDGFSAVLIGEGLVTAPDIIRFFSDRV